MMDQHSLRDTHKKTCIDCGKVWNCKGCLHKSTSGLCVECRDLQHTIIELEEAHLDQVSYF